MDIPTHRRAVFGSALLLLSLARIAAELAVTNDVPSEYIKTREKVRSARDRAETDLELIKGTKSYDLRSGHLRKEAIANLSAVALAQLNISDERLARIMAAQEQGAKEAASQQSLGDKLGMMVNAGDRTLTKLKTVGSQVSSRVSTHLATGITKLVGSPLNCSQDTVSGFSQQLLTLNSSQLTALNDTLNEISNDSLFLEEDTTGCKEEIAELPVLIKWLVGLDDAESQVQPPKTVKMARNVAVVLVVVFIIVLLGFCIGRHVHQTPPSPQLPVAVTTQGRALPNQRIALPNGASVNVFNPQARNELTRASLGANTLMRSRIKSALE